MKPARILLLSVIGCLIGLFFALDLERYLSLSQLQAHQQQLAVWVDAHFWQATLLFMLIYIASTALSLPGASLITLAGSAVFGVVWGLVLVSFASTLGATLAFLSARFLLRDWVSARFGNKLATLQSGMAKEGAFYLL
ncbi:MAG: TVP38/TMEM64 family protein, partial [Aeromonas sp.]